MPERHDEKGTRQVHDHGPAEKRGLDCPEERRTLRAEHHDEQVALTSDEKDHLWATWKRGPGLASDDSPFWAEVDKIIVARVAERIAEALRDAADAALTMYDPPVEECIRWSEWLRARADYRRIRPDMPHTTATDDGATT